jgi:hypothetical protein
VRLKFLEEGLSNEEDFIKRIADVEQYIMQQNKEIPTIKQKNENILYQSKSKPKYCNYHKTCSHSNGEWLVQRERKSKFKTSDRKDQKNGLIKDSSSYSSLLKFYCFLNESKNIVEAVIDTGTSRTFINKDTC